MATFLGFDGRKAMADTMNDLLAALDAELGENSMEVSLHRPH